MKKVLDWREPNFAGIFKANQEGQKFFGQQLLVNSGFWTTADCGCRSKKLDKKLFQLSSDRSNQSTRKTGTFTSHHDARVGPNDEEMGPKKWANIGLCVNKAGVEIYGHWLEESSSIYNWLDSSLRNLETRTCHRRSAHLQKALWFPHPFWKWAVQKMEEIFRGIFVDQK